MRYALIDHSTLTAVQRICGHIPIKNKTAIDGDIAAFENFVQAILFYDELIYVDDYKEQFRQDRAEFFPYMRAVPIDHFGYQDVLDHAKSLTDEIGLRIQGGQVAASEVGRFLQALGMHTAFTWDLASSKWFLNLKMLVGNHNDLDRERYKSLASLIFNDGESSYSNINRRPDPSFTILDSKGRPANREGDISAQLSMFTASLNWLALRTAFYTTISTTYRVDAILHPIRSAYQASIAAKFNANDPSFLPLLERMAGKTREAVRNIRSATEPLIFEQSLPLFSAWMVNQVGKPSQVIEKAFEMRGSPLFSQARAQLIELEDLQRNSERSAFLKKANKLVRGIDDLSHLMCETYGVNTPNGLPISPIIQAINVASPYAPIPELPFRVPLPSGLRELRYRKGFRGVFRNITHDLTAVERLGSIHEKLTSQARLTKDAFDQAIKLEDRRFFGKSSHWKRPA